MHLPPWQASLKPPSAAQNFPELLRTEASPTQSSFPLMGSGLHPCQVLPARTCDCPFNSATPGHLIPHT